MGKTPPPKKPSGLGYLPGSRGWLGWLIWPFGWVVDMPRLPDGRAGLCDRAGMCNRAGCRQSCDQISKGWFCLLLGGFGGGKLYILGVAGYNWPIWDVLALQGVREEAGEPTYGVSLINFFPIRQAVPGGPALAQFWFWAHLAGVSGRKNLYSGTRIIIIIYPAISAAIRGRGRMDASRCIWM